MRATRSPSKWVHRKATGRYDRPDDLCAPACVWQDPTVEALATGKPPPAASAAPAGEDAGGSLLNEMLPDAEPTPEYVELGKTGGAAEEPGPCKCM